MKSFITKLPDRDAEKFIEACKKQGKSYYEVLRELIYKWMKEQGVQTENAPISVKLSSIEERITVLEKDVAELKKQVEQIANAIEKLNKSGLYGFMKR